MSWATFCAERRRQALREREYFGRAALVQQYERLYSSLYGKVK